MKILHVLSLASAHGEKAVPPKDPLVRIEQLKSHTTRLMTDFFSSCKGEEEKHRFFKEKNDNENEILHPS